MLAPLGPNGAGKTTVMRTLFGLVLPDASTVRWRGRQVDARCWWRFGYMPEERGIDWLSHGNQQRVQLAVALVHDPDLLVLDEPFAGLDPIAVDALAARCTSCARRARRCCSPAISWIWSSTCARTW